MEDLSRLKTIVTELAKEPFNFEYNVSSFADLSPDDLLNVLNKVLGEIDGKQKVDFFSETGDSRACRIKEILRIWQYRPLVDNQYLENGLESGSQEVIWDILAWVLSRVDDLKIRSYLAQYLCKVQIPFEFMDDDLDELYHKYEMSISAFKKAHKRNMEFKSKEGINVLKRDSKNIDRDIECLSRKLDHVKAKAAGIQNRENLLKAIGSYRSVKDAYDALNSQIKKDTFAVTNLEQTLDIMRNRYIELRSINMVATPQGLLQRVDQDCEVLKYITMEKLPAEIEDKSKEVFAIQLVVENPPHCYEDLINLEEKISEVVSEISEYKQQLQERELDPAINYARHQISLSREKKLELYDVLEELHSELSSLLERKAERYRQIQMAISKLNNQSGPRIKEKDKERKRSWMDPTDAFNLSLKEKDFTGNSSQLASDIIGQGDGIAGDTFKNQEDCQRYITAVKEKAGNYKPKRLELQFMQNEICRLTGTKVLLDTEYQESIRNLQSLEKQIGIVGFSKMQEKLENLSTDKTVMDEEKLESVGKMSAIARDLNERIMCKKSTIEPLMKNVQCNRQSIQQLKIELEQEQMKLDAILMPILDKISEEVKKKGRFFELHNDVVREMKEKESKILQMNQLLNRAKRESELNDLKNHDMDLPEGGQTVRGKLETEMCLQKEAEDKLQEKLNFFHENQEYLRKQRSLWLTLGKVITAKLNFRMAGHVEPSGDDPRPSSGCSVNSDKEDQPKDAEELLDS